MQLTTASAFLTPAFFGAKGRASSLPMAPQLVLAPLRCRQLERIVAPVEFGALSKPPGMRHPEYSTPPGHGAEALSVAMTATTSSRDGGTDNSHTSEGMKLSRSIWASS